MRIARYFTPRFAFSFIRSILLKLRYGNKIKINPFKVFIDEGVRINIGPEGKVVFSTKAGRIYIGRTCDLGASQGGILTISGGVFLNKGCTIEARKQVYIGPNTMFGPYVGAFDNDHGFDQNGTSFRLQPHKCEAIHIGANVWIGSGAFIVKGSCIGNSTVVGANSLVSRKLEDSSLYAGNPAKLVRKL